jgi:hypothetical protein
MRTRIDTYSAMDDMYARVARTGFKKYVNLNDRNTSLKPSTPALAEWLNKYPCCDYYEEVRPQRTSHNARRWVVV